MHVESLIGHSKIAMCRGLTATIIHLLTDRQLLLVILDRLVGKKQRVLYETKQVVFRCCGKKVRPNAARSCIILLEAEPHYCPNVAAQNHTCFKHMHCKLSFTIHF
jgi:hypothetical protein